MTELSEVKRSHFKTTKMYHYKQFLKKIDREVNSNPNLLWGYIRRKTKVRRLPIRVELNGVTATNVSSSCRLFSDYFLSSFLPVNEHKDGLPEAVEYDGDTLSSFTIDRQE